MTPEGRVKKGIDDLLGKFNAYQHKPVQNGMGKPALDYHVAAKGIYAAIEAKALGEHPTVRQTRTMREMIAKGAAVFLIDSTDGDDYAQLHGWLVSPFPGFISTSAREWLLKAPNERSND